MIDDFAVPGTDYGFDDYGPGMALNFELLAPLSHLDLTGFFPSASPREESGARRGCIVLCREPALRDTLGKIDLLRGPVSIR